MKRSRSRREDDDVLSRAAAIHARRQRDVDAEVERRMQAIHEEQRLKKQAIDKELERTRKAKADKREKEVSAWRVKLGADVFQDLMVRDLQELERSLASNLVLFLNEHWAQLLVLDEATQHKPNDDKAYIRIRWWEGVHLKLFSPHHPDYACLSCRKYGFDTKACGFEMDWSDKKVPPGAKELIDDSAAYGGSFSVDVYFPLPSAAVKALPPIPCVEHNA